MLSWMLVAIFQNGERVTIPFENEQRCRTGQAAVITENKSQGRPVHTGCYVLTPTPPALKESQEGSAE